MVWRFVPAPKRTGKLSILPSGSAHQYPAFEPRGAAHRGGRQARPAPPVSLEVEVEPQPLVQQQVIYTVRLLSRGAAESTTPV